jgi:hypothetical protein
MNKLNLILFLAAIILFVGCEYNPTGENFVELTPPEKNISVEITLNDFKPSDTIYIYQNTTFTINIKSSKDLLKAEALWNGKVFANILNNELSFHVDPEQETEGVHKLTVNATFTTGTGSLAELMGLEGYTGDMSWNIRVIPNLEKHLELGYRINKDGFLEVFWKNILPESLIEKYTVQSGSTHKANITISDPKQRSFVDSGYVCGSVYYDVTTYLKDGYSLMQRLFINKPTPGVHFENLGLDKLRIYWDKPFAKGRFNLECDNKKIASGITDTTITITQIYGKNRQISLEIMPQIPEYDNSYNKYNTSNLFCQGLSLNLPNWDLYAYNTTDNIIYTSKHNSLVAFDASSMREINAVSILIVSGGFAFGGRIASAPHNSTVAVMTGEETWIFTDSRFINPIKIAPLSGNINTRLSALTSNDRFFVVQGGSNICNIFNTLTGGKIFEFPFTFKTIYDINDYVTVSENGQFLCASSENGMEVFEIKGTTTHLLYTDTRNYKGAMFVPSQPDKLLLRVDSDIEIRQIPGFNLLQTLDVSVHDAWLCNIDPVSMNLLYYQNDSLKVCKINNLTETIFKIRSDENLCKMFNNKIFTICNGGICFDIKPFLSH